MIGGEGHSVGCASPNLLRVEAGVEPHNALHPSKRKAGATFLDGLGEIAMRVQGTWDILQNHVAADMLCTFALSFAR